MVAARSSACRSSGTATRSCGSRPRSRAARSSPPTPAPSAAPGARRTSPRSSASTRNAPAFDGYWMEEVVPVLSAAAARRSSRASAASSPHEADRARRPRRTSSASSRRQDRRLRLAPLAARADRRHRGPAGRRPGRLAVLDRAPRRPGRGRAARARLPDRPDASEFQPVAWDEVGVEVYVSPRRGLTAGVPRRCSTASRSASLPSAVEAIPRHGEHAAVRRTTTRRPSWTSSPACSATACCSRSHARRLDGRGAAGPAGRRAPRRRVVLVPHARGAQAVGRTSSPRPSGARRRERPRHRRSAAGARKRQCAA